MAEHYAAAIGDSGRTIGLHLLGEAEMVRELGFNP